jgi:methionyl-tRNA formyltransferase
VTEAACAVLERQLDALTSGSAPRCAQDASQATTFGRRRPEDGRIDWSQRAQQIVDLVRAVTRPFPGAFTEVGGERLFVWKARAVPGRGAPGTLLEREPLRIAAGEAAVELLDWSWARAARRRTLPEPGTPLASP